MQATHKEIQQIEASLTRQERFFYAQGGFSYDPKVESPEQGMARCARELARAETYSRDWFETEWVDDPTADPLDWDGDGPMGERAYGCIVKANEEQFCSLWEIWDPSYAYRRVVAAELALGLMTEYGLGAGVTP